MANSGQSFREFEQAGWEESSVVTKYHEHLSSIARQRCRLQAWRPLRSADARLTCDSSKAMTPNQALHRTLNQRRFACWFRAGEGRR